MPTALSTKTLEEQPQKTSTGGGARRRRLLVVLGDWIGLALGMIVAQVVTSAPTDIYFLTVYPLVFWGWFFALKLYDSRVVTSRRSELGGIGRSGIRAAMTIGLLDLIFGRAREVQDLVLFVLLTVAFVSMVREIARAMFQRRRKAGQGLWASVLVANPDDAARVVASMGLGSASRHTVVGEVDPTGVDDPEALLTRTVATARSAGAYGVVLVESSVNPSTANTIVRGLLDAGFYIDLVSGLSDISADRLQSRPLGSGLATWIAPRPRDGWRSHAKRAFDVAVAGTALVVASPVFLLLAALVRFTSPGPVFFRQERVGRHGEPFKMLKFRSMVENAEDLLDGLQDKNENDGALFKMAADPRITKIGGFLRKTSLDELPQLINVVRNDMSLVGPRPALQSEMAAWDPELYSRLQVQPGITGMWQVSGRSETTFSEYSRLDLYYVHNWSLAVDLSILAKTLPAVLRSEGAY